MAEKVQKIGIIGGGRAGLRLFTLFSESKLTQVAYVMDINSDSPGMQAAKKAGARVFNRLEEALEYSVDFVIEITGSDEVANRIREILGEKSSILISHGMAYILIQVIEEKERKDRDQVKGEIGEVKTEIQKSMGAINSLVKGIENVTKDMRMLGLNARIEAARAGDTGRGFAVVAEEMVRAIDTIREIAAKIEDVDKSILAASQKIDHSIDKLKQVN